MKHRKMIVGRRGEVPLVSPYILLRFKEALTLGLRPHGEIAKISARSESKVYSMRSTTLHRREAGRIRHPWRCSLAVMVACLTCVVFDVARSGESPIVATSNSSAASGKVGDEVPSFYVRTVTGPLAGKSVCYVCRHGDRPVAMVLLRELGTDATALLKELNQTVDRHSAEGLRCFAVLVTGTPQREAPRLQTLAFDEKLDLPLTLASESIAAEAALNVDPEAAITVVLYEDRRIVSRFAHRAGTCNEAARREIVSAAEKLATK